MKKIFIALIAIGCLTLSGCDSFLDEDNKAGISNDQLYGTAVGFETLRTNAYASLRDIYGDTPYLLLAGTDLYLIGRNAPDPTYEYLNLNPSTASVKTYYINCYNALQGVNAALYYLDKPKDIDATKKAQYRAEFHFFRAFYHFLLVEQFGGIPINDEYTQSPRVNIPRASLADSYNFIISEFKKALDGSLPATTKNGTINQDIVNHYLGKAYLTRGWDLGDQNDFMESKKCFEKVFVNRGSTLQLTFKNLWAMDQENNNEVIFAVQYDAKSILSPTSGNNQQSLFGFYLGGAGTGQKNFSQQLYPSWPVHTWFSTNDQRYDDTFMLTLWEYYFDYYQGKNVPGVNNVAGFYPRAKNATDAALMESEFRVMTKNLTDFKNIVTADKVAFIKKWVPGFSDVTESTIKAASIYPFLEADPDPVVNERNWRKMWSAAACQPGVKKFDMNKLIQSSQTESYRDIVIASLSETMLLHSEASIGLKDYATAQTYINTVLARPGNSKNGVTMTMTLPTTTQEDALEAYLKESGKELLGQYCGRWPELRRTKMLKRMFYKYNFDYLDGLRLGQDPIGQKLYRPIPADAIDINEGLSSSDQNPGYSK